MEPIENNKQNNSSNDIGESLELSEQDIKFISDYQKETAELSEVERRQRFSTIIRKKGSCGFGGFGKFDYLLNTDTKNPYKVTIRIKSTTGTSHEEFDKIVNIQAGGTINLGCTKSGSTAWHAEYIRTVIKESKI